MDFKLTEEQLMLQSVVRDFAQKELKPISREFDAKTDPNECTPWELIKRAWELGIKTSAVPVAYGGGGLDLLTHVIMFEEIGAGDLGFYTLIDSSLAQKIYKFGTKEQKDEFLPKFVQDATYLICSGNTEPDHGTDNALPYDAPGSAMSTYAERKGSEYVVNGRKHFICRASHAKLCLLTAGTKKDVGITEGMSMFLVPTDTPGFSVGTVHDKLGRRTDVTAEIIFEDMHIPVRYLLGKENEGWEVYRWGTGMLQSTASLVGCLRECYEQSLDYARTRIQGGKPIIEHPTIASRLGEMRVAIEACRLLLWRHAWAYDNNYGYDPSMSFMLKWWVNKAAITVVNRTVDIFAGMASDKSMPIEKYLRDIYSTLHVYGGAGDMPLVKGVGMMPTF